MSLTEFLGQLFARGSVPVTGEPTPDQTDAVLLSEFRDLLQAGQGQPAEPGAPIVAPNTPPPGSHGDGQTPPETQISSAVVLPSGGALSVKSQTLFSEDPVSLALNEAGTETKPPLTNSPEGRHSYGVLTETATGLEGAASESVASHPGPHGQAEQTRDDGFAHLARVAGIAASNPLESGIASTLTSQVVASKGQPRAESGEGISSPNPVRAHQSQATRSDTTAAAGPTVPPAGTGSLDFPSDPHVLVRATGAVATPLGPETATSPVTGAPPPTAESSFGHLQAMSLEQGTSVPVVKHVIGGTEAGSPAGFQAGPATPLPGPTSRPGQFVEAPLPRSDRQGWIPLSNIDLPLSSSLSQEASTVGLEEGTAGESRMTVLREPGLISNGHLDALRSGLGDLRQGLSPGARPLSAAVAPQAVTQTASDGVSDQHMTTARQVDLTGRIDLPLGSSMTNASLGSGSLSPTHILPLTDQLGHLQPSVAGHHGLGLETTPVPETRDLPSSPRGEWIVTEERLGRVPTGEFHATEGAGGLKNEPAVMPASRIEFGLPVGAGRVIETRSGKGTGWQGAEAVSWTPAPLGRPAQGVDPSNGVFRLAAQGAPQMDSAETVSQIVESARYLSQLGQRSLEIRLQPAFLGRIRIDTVLDAKESLNATISVEEPRVRLMLEGNLPALMDGFKEAGVKLESLVLQDMATGEDGPETPNRPAGEPSRQQEANGDDPEADASNSEGRVFDDGRIHYFA